MELNQVLKVNKGITSIIGSGGKTTLISMLTYELIKKGKVIITTTTHIYPFANIKNLIDPSIEEVKEELDKNSCVCIGSDSPDGKMVTPNISFKELKEIADYILVEADGSKQKPIKAHNDNEPVIIDENDYTILLVGSDGLNKKVIDVVHRPDIFCEKLSCGLDDIVTAELLSKLIIKEGLSDIVMLNKLDDANREEVMKLSRLIDKDCFYGSLKEGKIYACTH